VAIPSDLYDREYFLSDRCEGYERYRDGLGLSPLKDKLVGLLAPHAGLRILDAGCGRGEVLLACARLGADVAGLDYAEAAVELTLETLAGIEGAEIRLGGVSSLPWPDDSFDRALLGDVIEHLEPEEAADALLELRRVLRPGGTLVVHTSPNKLFLRFGWPLARLALRGRRADSARRLDAWIRESKTYHVNEQSPFSLRRAVRRAGFGDVRTWIDPDVLRGGEHHLTRGAAGPVTARIVASRPLRLIFGNDLFATGRV
jgi:ubiquinone/menaquinone biosynthesis C-methylase UbiE